MLQKEASSDRPSIVFMATTPETVNAFLIDQMQFMITKGWAVTIICSPGDCPLTISDDSRIKVAYLKMAREPSPIADLVSVFKCYFLLKRVNPDVISFGTPKAGLIGSVSSFLSRVKSRVYMLRGLRFEGFNGFQRQFFTLIERIVSACSTDVFCVSESVKKIAVQEHAVQQSKARVVGSGSSNGVNVDKFSLSCEALDRGTQLRIDNGIPLADFVVGFVGRMVCDKGVPELLSAVSELFNHYPKLWLLLAGPREMGDDLRPEHWKLIESSDRVVWIGSVNDQVGTYAAMNLVALPTHREGLPNVALEAAAMSKPLVISNATGAIDAVQPGVTGTVFPTGDELALSFAIRQYIDDPSLCVRHGKAGASWVREHFESTTVWEAYEHEYRSIFQRNGSSRRQSNSERTFDDR